MGKIEQYKELKKKHPNCVILFREEDCYMSMNEDAEAVSQVLGVTIRAGEDNTFWTSFGHDKLDRYLPRLIRAGKRVAICERIEAPKKKKFNFNELERALIEAAKVARKAEYSDDGGYTLSKLICLIQESYHKRLVEIIKPEALAQTEADAEEAMNSEIYAR